MPTITASSNSMHEYRSPKRRSKWMYPTLRESWLPGMTITFGQSKRWMYSAAVSNSCR